LTRWYNAPPAATSRKSPPYQRGLPIAARDLGSDAMTLVNTPKIAVLSGENTFDNEFGQVWYYFEQDLRYPPQHL
jgi:hypothetical protein